MNEDVLWFIPSARNLPVVKNWVDRTNFVDKIIVKNFQRDMANEIATQFFLKRSEYKRFLISSDDVVGCPEHVKMLIADEGEKGFPIVSGWCNHAKLRASLALTPISTEVLDASKKKPFPGMTFDDYGFPLIKEVVEGRFGFPFFQTWFHGMALTLIHKAVLRKIPFKPFRMIHDEFCVTPTSLEHGRGSMYDLQWAIDCAAEDIPNIIDARVFLLHVFGTIKSLRVGTEPTVLFVPAKNKRFSTEEIEEINAIMNEAARAAWNA